MHNMDEYKKFITSFKNGSIDIGEDFYTRNGTRVPYVGKGKDWNDTVRRTLIVSFGQNRLEMMQAYDDGNYTDYCNTAEKVSNTKNHQIWWPKGTIARSWFKDDLFKIADAIKEPTETISISEFTDYIVAVFKTFGWKNCRYTVKHAVKNLSLANNNIDSDTFVVSSAGSLRGLEKIFGETLTNRKKQMKAVDTIIHEIGDLVKYDKYINTEAHLCYYWKYSKDE